MYTSRDVTKIGLKRGQLSPMKSKVVPYKITDTFKKLKTW